MRRLRLLRPWEWIGYLAAVIVFAIACVYLSQWQFDRREQAVEQIDKVQTNWSAETTDIDSLVPQLDAFDDALEYRSVTLTGMYEQQRQVLVRNRPLNGSPGFEVLVPLRLDDGRVFFVDRGWVASASDGGTPDVPDAPTGEVTVVVRLKPAQPAVDRGAPEGQIASFELTQLVADGEAGATFTGAYGQRQSETPAAAENPQVIPQPSLSEGSHLSYALQWLAFAVLAFVGFGYAIRATLRRIEDTGGSEIEAQRRRRVGRSRADADTEAEDAILDRTH